MESSWSILLGLAVINLPFLLIVIIGDRISGQSIKNLHPKDNKIISESELNSTNMNNISPRLKPRLVILVLCVISFLFFGFKGNGEVIYLKQVRYFILSRILLMVYLRDYQMS